jgi:hypothetical protein
MLVIRSAFLRSVPKTIRLSNCPDSVVLQCAIQQVPSFCRDILKDFLWWRFTLVEGGDLIGPRKVKEGNYMLGWERSGATHARFL